MTMNLGENVRRLRRQLNLSQTELAKKIGVSLDMIGRIERGVWSGPVDRVLELAQFFGVPPWELDESLKPFHIERIPLGKAVENNSTSETLPDFRAFNKATIIEAIKPIIEAPAAREEIANRLSNLLDNQGFRSGAIPKDHAELKCRIMEQLISIQSDEILNEIISFIEFKVASDKKRL